jgi:arylsulfatase
MATGTEKGWTETSWSGVIGDTWRESTPWWPPEPTPPDGAPNVVLIVLDDVGYAQLGCYGSDIATPEIDRLAAGGVRLANFHTTALCSPTRACLMTGRNHHSVGMGRISDLAVGFPGYSGRIGREHGFAPEILGAAGYATYAVGKWHLTPDDETHMAAPRRSWPVGRGFQRWYGFHGGETHQFVPSLYQDNHSVPPPGRPEDGYHLTVDLVDHAVRYLSDLRAVDAAQPFFLYFATGACHSPHHAPPSWIERYAGHFDAGWDDWRERTFARQLELGLIPPGTELSPRPSWVPAWDALAAEDQRVAARFMECFAGYLSHADDQIGRLLRFVEQELGEGDDTLVVLVSDNGASAEGGVLGSINDVRLWNGMPAGAHELQARIGELGTPSAHNNYPWGWTMAGNTPFKRWKREVHEGGVADPCIVRWPRRLESRGEIRHQFAHAVDVLPTVLELTGIDPPRTLDGVAQAPIEGTSFAAVLDDGSVPSAHVTQYFEMLGSRAIYHDGWKAVTFKPLGRMYTDDDDPDLPFDQDRWELYHVAADFSECHDLAEQQPDRLDEMVRRWWDEARRYRVLPLDNRPLAALLHPRPSPRRERTTYVLRPMTSPVPETVAPKLHNRSHVVRAELDVPAGTVPEGVLVAQGSVLGGWAVYLLDGRPHYVHNLVGKERHRVTSDVVVPEGAHVVGFEFVSNGDFTGTGRLYLDDALVGEAPIPRFTLARFSITGSGLTCGYEVGPAVSDDYEAPFRSTATIRRVTIDVSGAAYQDVEAEFAAIMAEQ